MPKALRSSLILSGIACTAAPVFLLVHGAPMAYAIGLLALQSLGVASLCYGIGAY